MDSQNNTPPQVDTSTPVTSTPVGAAAQPQPVGFQQPLRKKKTGLIVGSIVAGALVVLGGTGALAYNLWYQNPDKVVHDAIINAIEAKALAGTSEFVMTTKDMTMKVSIDGKAVDSEGMLHAKAVIETRGAAEKMSLKLEGSALYKDEIAYIKLDNVKEIFDTYLAQMPMLDAQTMKQVTKIINKIDGQWVSIKASDYEDVSKEVSEQQTCISDASKKLSNDKEARRELTNLYSENRIIEVKDKLGSDDEKIDGSLGYEIGINNDATRAFIEGIGDTAYGKALKECDDTIDFKKIADSFKETEKDSDVEVKTRIWVSRFGHEITQFSMSAKEGDSVASFIAKPEFNTDVTIDAPKDAISLKDLIAEIQEIISEATTGSPVSPYIEYDYSRFN
jgi:hypothetical protein